jgi:dsDNA-specific endonuclease/ATPase MutS2
MKIGDDVTLNGKIIEVSASGNPIIELKSGIRMLVKSTDINTWHPNKKSDGIDRRKGN